MPSSVTLQFWNFDLLVFWNLNMFSVPVQSPWSFWKKRKDNFTSTLCSHGICKVLWIPMFCLNKIVSFSLLKTLKRHWFVHFCFPTIKSLFQLSHYSSLSSWPSPFAISALILSLIPRMQTNSIENFDPSQRLIFSLISCNVKKENSDHHIPDLQQSISLNKAFLGSRNSSELYNVLSTASSNTGVPLTRDLIVNEHCPCKMYFASEKSWKSAIALQK